MLRSRQVAALAFILFSVGERGEARAAPTKDEAAAAYDRGAAAYDRGEFLVAATELARADELAHSPVTLELAISAAVRADDPVLAMTLVDRVEKRRSGSTKTLDAVADKAKKKLGARVGKLNVSCPPASSSCEVMVDGAAFEPGAPRYLTVGAHKVAVTLPKTQTTMRTTERYDVLVETGKTMELAVTPTPPTPEASPTESTSSAPPATDRPPTKESPPALASSGLSPTWFWVGVGLTVVGGGAVVASALDTRSKHQAFIADRSSLAASEAGQNAELRTYIIAGGVGVIALATAALGLFFVDWKGKSAAR